ncbi:hypothetical protein WJ542_07290 [Paraburkholderia sp. B3]|uniref:hypothetical protein n=1 Tax=Paraburkholderia sp. B3 TaxID=3134791 RepID=UPI0039823CEE
MEIEDRPFYPKGREDKYVRPSELLDAAHEEESEFLMDRYKEYQKEEDRGSAHRAEIQTYAFYVLFYLIFNFWLPGNNSNHTITHWIEDYSGTSQLIWIALLGLAWLVLFLVPQYESGRRVYCPPLHRKLEAEEKKRREEQQEREWRNRFD